MAEKSGAAHLNEFHRAAHEFHSRMISAHRAQLKKAEGDELDKAAQSAKSFQEQSIVSHMAMQVFHAGGMSETEKAIQSELHKGDALVPTNVSAVADPAKGPRAVIRPGQREIAGADMPKVDSQFEHLVKVDD